MKIYVIVGHQGSYSDYTSWVVCAYPTEDQAKQHVLDGASWMNEVKTLLKPYEDKIRERVRFLTINLPRNEIRHDEEVIRLDNLFEAKRKELLDSCPIDDKFAFCPYEDNIRWTYEEVDLFDAV